MVASGPEESTYKIHIGNNRHRHIPDTPDDIAAERLLTCHEPPTHSTVSSLLLYQSHQSQVLKVCNILLPATLCCPCSQILLDVVEFPDCV